MTDYIQTERDGAVLTIRLNRADKKNAITAAMYSAMAAALRSADIDSSAKVAILTGSGDSFTAGNDLKDFAENPPTDPSAPVFQFMDAMASFTKPIVAGVNGVAVGIGTTLLLHCDWVIAVPSAKFALPFVNFALVPEYASSLLLPRFIGARKAQELLMSGEAFDAESALTWGLIGAVVAADQLESAIKTKAMMLAAKPPSALRHTKSLLRGDLAQIKAVIAAEAKVFGAQLKSAELQEAVSAFFAKRPADFSKFS
ncbi:MAG: enoyl-CoA hydratase [Alphaproteobacteria bacterium]|jgi:enoyl-CoA hydratase/carnithine racemase|nr:enoyl-CoA hydratase [Alphaproteobacteria bacterium]PHY01351.1 MAG: enoyl-CoA hydratase [Rhodospirillaceae bacterium]